MIPLDGLVDFQRVRPQGIFHLPLGIIDPSLDLGRRKFKGPTGLGHRRLALKDLDHQRCLPLRRPPFDPTFPK